MQRYTNNPVKIHHNFEMYSLDPSIVFKQVHTLVILYTLDCGKASIEGVTPSVSFHSLP